MIEHLTVCQLDHNRSNTLIRMPVTVPGRGQSWASPLLLLNCVLNIFIETSCTLDNRWCLFCAYEIFLGVRTIPGITDCRPSCSVFLNIVHWKTLQWRCYLYSPSSNSNIYITCMCIVPKHMERSVSPHLKIYSSFPANRRLQWWYLYGSSGLVRVICTHSCAQYF